MKLTFYEQKTVSKIIIKQLNWKIKEKIARKFLWKTKRNWKRRLFIRAYSKSFHWKFILLKMRCKMRIEIKLNKIIWKWKNIMNYQQNKISYFINHHTFFLKLKLQKKELWFVLMMNIHWKHIFQLKLQKKTSIIIIFNFN